MPGFLDEPTPDAVVTMPKGKPAPENNKPARTAKAPPGDNRQVNFRASADLMARLDGIAEALGLDVSNLVRLVLNEHLAEYQERAEQVLRGRQKGPPPS